MRGKFIVVEGLDGSGKGTQMALLCDYLKSRGRSVAAYWATDAVTSFR